MIYANRSGNIQGDFKMDAIKEIVSEQAEDDGLWFEAQTAPEAYLQAELRRLHAAIEGVGKMGTKIDWVVNDNAELGVKIGDDYHFLYKGDSIIYKDGLHDDGSKMHVRTVGKREFGECCHPVNYDNPKLIGAVSLDDCDRWVELPASKHPEAV